MSTADYKHFNKVFHNSNSESVLVELGRIVVERNKAKPKLEVIEDFNEYKKNLIRLERISRLQIDIERK
jgi:hypothetical protein